MPAPLVVLGAVSGVVGLIGFLVDRAEAASTTEQLDRIEEGLVELRNDLDDVGAQVFGQSLAQVDTAFDKLRNYELQPPEAAQTERLLIINEATEGLNEVLRQADTLISGRSSLDTLNSAMIGVNYAIQTRMLVAARLEAGPLGALGIREALEEVFTLVNSGVSFARGEIRDAVSSDTTFKIGIPFVSVDRTEIDVSSGLTSTTREATVNVDYGDRFGTNHGQHVDRRKNQLIDDVVASDARAYGLDQLQAAVYDYENLWLGDDVIGDNDDNELRGSNGAAEYAHDFLAGLAGNDIIDGLVGDDSIRGDRGEDILYGRAGYDVLMGGEDDDIIDGGADFDTARFIGDSRDYAIEGGTRVAVVTGPDGTDTLFHVESLLFEDREVVLEDLGPGAILDGPRRIGLLYEAALDRDGDIDNEGVNFWIDVLNAGYGERNISRDFLHSPEFETNFGDPDAMSDRQLVEVLYRNVLDRDGEAAGVDFWTEVMENPAFTRPDLLLAFAVSPENLNGSPHIDRLIEIGPDHWDFFA